MLTLLRWLIGVGCVLGLLMLVLILFVGKGFDVYRSGAGGEDVSRAVVTVGVPALLVAMFVTVLGAGGRWLLHVTAVAVAAALAGVGGSVIRTNPGEGGLYAGFLILWLIYYALTLR